MSLSPSSSPSLSPSTYPPPPPPKPSSQEASRHSTPLGHPPWPPPPVRPALGLSAAGEAAAFSRALPQPTPYQRGAGAGVGASEQPSHDPGDRWRPSIVEDKSKHDLAVLLARSELLTALASSPSTGHPSIVASQELLQASLEENISLASHLNKLEARLSHLRSLTQAQLLSTIALERQWRQRQSDIDRALAPFSPSALYQKLSQGVPEQEMICRALEETFLECDGGTTAEKDITEWVRRYREAKKVYYLRREQKERWDEGRVGGWR